MFKKYLAIAGMTAVVMMNYGCSAIQPKETLLDRNWGRSFETSRYSQVLNPEAEKNLDPIVGLDGQAAAANMADYQKTFEPGSAATVYNISLTGLGGK